MVLVPLCGCLLCVLVLSLALNFCLADSAVFRLIALVVGLHSLVLLCVCIVDLVDGGLVVIAVALFNSVVVVY